jgi:hypothetical protein
MEGETVKCSSKTTRYDYKNIRVVMEETDGKVVSVRLHNGESTWYGSVEEIRELSEAASAILLVHSPWVAETETLNAGSSPLDAGLSAEPPKPGAGDVVVQMTVEQFRWITDIANQILEGSADFPFEKDSVRMFARRVNDALGGASL